MKQLRVCPTGKRVFTSRSKAAAVLVKRMTTRRGELRVYGCDACGGWHLTSENRRA